MNQIYALYFWLPNFKKYGFLGKVVNKALEMILKRVFDRTIPQYFRRSQKNQGSGINAIKREIEYIVTLTSFPARIDEIWISLECILRQTFKPDLIYLWLSKDQFLGKTLPKSLTDLEKRGLTIKFCDDDLKSHKKYFYTMQLHRDANIITVDDDLYYDKNLLKNVVEIHKANSDCIASNRAHKIKFNNEGQIEEYKKWEKLTTSEIPSHLILQTGGCGTLYPPDSLIDKTFDKVIFKELCFNADDVWLKIMSVLSNKKVVTNKKYNKNHISISKTQNEKLVSTNVKSGGNDAQIIKLMNYFNIDYKTFQ